MSETTPSQRVGVEFTAFEIVVEDVGSVEACDESPGLELTPRTSMEPARAEEVARLAIKMPLTTAFMTVMRGPPCFDCYRSPSMAAFRTIVIRHAGRRLAPGAKPEAGMAETRNPNHFVSLREARWVVDPEVNANDLRTIHAIRTTGKSEFGGTIVIS